MFLQNYVVAIVEYTDSDEGAIVSRLLGSAFFINQIGTCLTARHVLEAALSQEKCGILTGPPVGADKTESIAKILKYDHAPSPYDISVFQTSRRVSHPFSLSKEKPTVWQDVATYGYPESLERKVAGAAYVNSRHLKGYIQRLNEPDVGGMDGCLSYETDFPVGKGLSGSPLFFHKGISEEVLGVCVGTHRSEIVLSEHVSLTGSGEKVTERHMKVEEYGEAHDLMSLREWQPSNFGGLSIADLFEVTREE